MPRSIGFDLDGTLIDSVHGIHKAYVRSLNGLLPSSHIINIDNFRSKIGGPFNFMIDELHPNLLPQAKEDAVRIFRSFYDTNYWKDYKIYPGAIEVLRALKETNTKCFVVTDKPQTLAISIVRKEFPDLFSEIIGNNDYLGGKSIPKHERLKRLADSTSMDLYIGDTFNDFNACQVAGIKRFVYCQYGYNSNPTPDFTRYATATTTKVILCSDPTMLGRCVMQSTED